MILERIGDVAILRINGGRANAIDDALLAGVTKLRTEAEESGARAIVLTGYERFFSAGLDLPALIELDRSGMERFMRVFADTMLGVFTCPLPVVAAINGHAIAGGCVLALQADRRIMADGPYRIGLNEVQLGIGLPADVIETARAQLSSANLARVLLEGALSLPAEALALGLVDAVVPADSLEARSLALATALARVSGPGFRQIKGALRRPTVEVARSRQDAEINGWLDSWFAPAIREKLILAASKLKR